MENIDLLLVLPVVHKLNSTRSITPSVVFMKLTMSYLDEINLLTVVVPALYKKSRLVLAKERRHSHLGEELYSGSVISYKYKYI